MLTKVISGGQIGADVAGLRAAKATDIETGGWMPRGFRTLTNDRPEYVEEFGVQQSASVGYPPRTRMNVRDSDGTIRFAANFQSAGEKLTLKETNIQNKPCFDVPVPIEIEPSEVAAWIEENEISVLNVAGNAIEELEPIVESFLYDVFQITQKRIEPAT